MTLIKSISGIRGTIGGEPGTNLTPPDIVKFVYGYSAWVCSVSGSRASKIVVGRDARLSGEMLSNIVCGTLVALGHEVVDIGLATTPTTELAVAEEKAAGGIILTASHNPKEWNALKLLNAKGEFLSDAEGKKVLEFSDTAIANYPEVEAIGHVVRKDYTDYHIEHVLNLEHVDVEAIKKAKLRIVVDGINSVGGVVVPELLKVLGVADIVTLNCEPHGDFAHNPEPVPENLIGISETVKAQNADMGIVVDPDVDRLAFIADNGEMFGEEYTLVAIADYILKYEKGNTVSNLSSSRALSDVAGRYGCTYSAAAVGEVNVVAEMKKTGAVIGGEGNGGVIYPKSHYGRDALVGIGLFLSHFVKEGKSMTELKKSYPRYFISKNKIKLTPELDVDSVLDRIKQEYRHEKITDTDGVKIDFPEGWVHLRKSNTEPIIRIYSEAKDKAGAKALAQIIIDSVKSL